jgi:hypothetical protein
MIPFRHGGQEVELHALLIPDVDGDKLSVSRLNLFRPPPKERNKGKKKIQAT